MTTKDFKNLDEKDKIMTECVICLKKYEENDAILELKCDKRHYFHKECITQWVEKNHNTCPLCKTVIQIDGNQA